MNKDKLLKRLDEAKTNYEYIRHQKEGELDYLRGFIDALCLALED